MCKTEAHFYVASVKEPFLPLKEEKCHSILKTEKEN